MDCDWIVVREEGRIVKIVGRYVLRPAAMAQAEYLGSHSGVSHRCIERQSKQPMRTGSVKDYRAGIAGDEGPHATR